MGPNILRCIYDFFIKHWFVSTLILTLSSNWFVFLTFYGKDYGLINTKGVLKPEVHLLTIGFVILSVIFALVKTLADRHNEKAKNNGQFILEAMIDSMDLVAIKKLKRFADYIHTNKGRNDITYEHVFKSIAQPEAQINSMLENIQVSLSEIFGITRNNIAISIIYKISEDDEWKWLNQLDQTGGLGLKEIVSSSSSSFNYVKKHQEPFFFYPDKKEAIKLSQYTPEPKESKTGVMGSVLIREMSIGNDIKYVSAYLCISTYGKQLCEQKDISTKNKIESIILPSFVKRLQLEMSLLYIKEIMILNK